MDQFASLEWEKGEGKKEKEQSTIVDRPSSIPPIVLDLSPTLHSPLFTLHSPVGSFLFSYVVGACFWELVC